MICSACRSANHENCVDIDPIQVRLCNDGRVTGPLRPGRSYRSCDCQHRPGVQSEPRQEPAGAEEG